MKKLIIAVIMVISMPFVVNAKRFELESAEMSIELNEEKWYVFTRENLKDNPKLEELGISYDYINSVFETRNGYLDAILYYDDGTFIEIFISKTPIDDIVNFTNYSDKEVKQFTKEVAKVLGSEEYDLYKNDYKYSYVEYTTHGYYTLQYYTVVNGNDYTILFQNPEEFLESEKEEIKEIIDTISFNIDTSLVEENTELVTGIFDGVLESAIRGAIIGGIIGVIVEITIKSIKKKKNVTSKKEK